jgi:isopenicillin-N N-acyltransferase like protein
MVKEIILSGSPKEIGRQHGELGKKQVLFSLDMYERFFKRSVNLTWEQAKEMAKKHLRSIEAYNIDYLEEMEGIAKGTGVEFEDILTLNARTEIALTQNTMDGCTSLAVLPPIAERTFLGQNWDWRPSQIHSLLLVRIKQEKKPDICMVTEGGIIGKIGFNSSGVGVCLNAIRANVKSDGVPIHLGLRRILDSNSLDEALSQVENQQMGSSANFLIGFDDRNGGQKAVNLEVSPKGNDKKETTDDSLYHTNHLCSNRLIVDIGLENLMATDNSFVRIDRMNEFITNVKDTKQLVNESIIKHWFSDHYNFPQAICRHEEDGVAEHMQSRTVFSVVMNLTECQMLFMEGNPCSPLSEKTIKLESYVN